MTRDEFVKALGKALDIESMTDVYVRAGMLKLDEPKSAREKFIEIMKLQNYSEASRGWLKR